MAGSSVTCVTPFPRRTEIGIAGGIVEQLLWYAIGEFVFCPVVDSADDRSRAIQDQSGYVATIFGHSMC